MTEPRRLRARYLELLEEHTAAIRLAAERVAYDYVLLSTDESIAPVLATALAARANNRSIVRRGPRRDEQTQRDKDRVPVSTVREETRVIAPSR